MTKLYIIKIGASILDNPGVLASFLQAFTKIDAAKILVHGGGSIATQIGRKMGIVSKYEQGRRITDEETRDLVTMVYGGLINKKVVAALQALGCNALGLTGADANVMPARKREVQAVDYGWVGDIEAHTFSDEWLMQQISSGICPVMAPITHDGKGNLLNTNADSIAAELAISMSKRYDVNLVFGFEKAGVLRNPNDETSVIKTLNKDEFLALKEHKQIYAGMIPKLDNAFRCIEAGVNSVRIGMAERIEGLILKQDGTIIS